MDGVWDGLVIAFGRSGGGKDEHVEMEKEPPKRCGINRMGISRRDGMNCISLELEESGFILFSKMSSPGRAKVWGMVGSVSQNKRYALIP